jgi:tetratricopeptide (TPR) repeat protein
LTNTYSKEISIAEDCRQTGQLRKAEQILSKILLDDDKHHTANYLMGMLHHQKGQNELAIAFLQNAVASRPDSFEPLINLGIIQHGEGYLSDAQLSLESAILIKSEDPKAFIALGLVHIDQNDFPKANTALHQSLTLAPDNVEANVKMAYLRSAQNKIEKSVEFYRKAVELDQFCSEAHHGLALIQKQNEVTADILRMESTYNSIGLSEYDRMIMAYALGKCFDDLGQYNKAFDFFRVANQIQRKNSSYTAENLATFFERHKKGFSRRFLENCNEDSLDENTPIFIVGMPRSGTSLVEQILASHPEVYGAGEVEYTRIIVDGIISKTGKPFPQDIDKIPVALLVELGRLYIDKLKNNAGEANRVCDKLPHNFLRIPLIAALMPNAKIIHCDRKPIDVCLSIFQNYFSEAHGYSTNLKELGIYFNHHKDLMNHWNEILPGHIYKLSYEQLVLDPEKQIRQVLDYCELPFHPDCLSFHKTRRHVITPSKTQVKEPVYRSAIDRWKHYEKHLLPLMRALDE